MKLFTGLNAGICWALDTVILGIALSRSFYMNTREAIFLAPFVSTFLHDTFSCIWMFFYIGIKKQYRKVWSALRSKSGKYIMLGAVFGGPVGMTGYVFAIRYLGASYTAMLSALFPAFGALASHIFLKEELRKVQVLGLLLSIVGMAMLGCSAQTEISKNFILGFGSAVLCIIGWVTEVVICAYGMKNPEVDNEQALMIRQATSALFHGIVILSLVKGHSFAIEAVKTGAADGIILAALCGTCSYLCYYKTIRNIGPSKGMALNVTYAAWAIVFEFLLLGKVPDILKVSSGLLVLAGSLLTAVDFEKKETSYEKSSIN